MCLSVFGSANYVGRNGALNMISVKPLRLLGGVMVFGLWDGCYNVGHDQACMKSQAKSMPLFAGIDTRNDHLVVQPNLCL